MTLVQADGPGACQPTLSTALPIVVGDIPAHSFKTFDVALSFSECAGEARFNMDASYSSDLGTIAAGVIDVALEQ